MKIAIDKTVLLAGAQQHPFQIDVQKDGLISISVTYQGTRVVMLVDGREATAIGVQLIQKGAVAMSLQQAIQDGVDVEAMMQAAPPPIAKPNGG